jgi:cytochrome b561
VSDIFYLWLFTRADTIQSFFQFLMISSGVCFVILLIARVITFSVFTDTPKNMTTPEVMTTTIYKAFVRWGYVALALFLISGGVYMATPGKRDVAIIVGGHLMVEAVKSPVVQETATKLNELIQGELDSALDDLHQKQQTKLKRDQK